MRLLFMNGRHWKIMLVITMQYPLGVPPNLRTNIDYTFILREPYINNRKRIYENYAGMFSTFESFCQVMDQCTENYECLVISNNAKSNKLEDQIFWYKLAHNQFKLVQKNSGKCLKIWVLMMKKSNMIQINLKKDQELTLKRINGNK